MKKPDCSKWSELRAWAYMARVFRKSHAKGRSSFDDWILETWDALFVEGICTLLMRLHWCGLNDAIKKRMQTQIQEARDKRDLIHHPWMYAKTKAGALHRAKFCERQAARLRKKRLVKQ